MVREWCDEEQIGCGTRVRAIGPRHSSSPCSACGRSFPPDSCSPRSTGSSGSYYVTPTPGRSRIITRTILPASITRATRPRGTITRVTRPPGTITPRLIQRVPMLRARDPRHCRPCLQWPLSRSQCESRRRFRSPRPMASSVPFASSHLALRHTSPDRSPTRSRLPSRLLTCSGGTTFR
jgi:hypothetical protein